MADSVTIPATGSGTATPVIATDDVGGVHYQRVKLVDGTADSAALIAGDATNGLDVDVTRVGGNVATTVADGADVALGALADAAVGDASGSVNAHARQIAKLLGAGISVTVAGGSIAQDKTAFVEGTTNFTPVGAVVNDTLAGDVAEDNRAALRMTPKRALHVNLRDASAAEIGTTTTPLVAAGNVAHDGVDAGNPNKIGAKAIAHGANPTAVAAADRTDLYANRAGILFVMGGHPNTVSLRATAAIAQTDVALVTVSAGTKIVVTRVMVTIDKATTVNVSVRVGFGAANTPTTTGVLASHPGMDPGSGFVTGDGSGILGVGADGEDLRVTNSATTTGNIDVCVSYFTVES